MRPDINNLRNIRNNYYNNNTYERNRRNNGERLRNHRQYYDNQSSSSEDDDNYRYHDYHENINSNYSRNYNRQRNYNNSINNRINKLIQKITGIIKIFFRDENVIYAIIVINILVNLAWQCVEYNKEEYYDTELLDFMQKHFTVSWTNVIKKKRYWTLLTSVFSHEDIMHLINNMSAFYSFSLPIIRCIGKKKFITSYILSGISSSLAHNIYYHSVVPKLEKNSIRTLTIWDFFFPRYIQNAYDNVTGLGASGAITGMNVIFACLYPSNLMYYKNYLSLPAWLAMMLYMAGDFYRSLTLTNGHIDTIGHVGGGIAGYLYYLYSLKPFIYR